MWQSKASQLLFLAQFLYGSGFVLGPLMTSPYVTGGVDSEPSDNVTLHTTISVSERRAKVVVPFIISGGIQAICEFLQNNELDKFYPETNLLSITYDQAKM